MRPTLLTVAAVLCAATAASAAPRWPRLSWTDRSDESITVSWTDDVAGAGSVEVRLPGGSPTTATATSAATGRASSAPPSPPPSPG